MAKEKNKSYIGLTREIKGSTHTQHNKTDVNNIADNTIESLYCPLNTHKKN